MTEQFEKASEAAHFLLNHFGQVPEALVILGSGLGAFADNLENARRIDYREIPHLPVPTVEGHHGKLLVGDCGGVRVGVMQGRFHYYEGYSLEEATFPIRVAKLMGIERLVVTNAAGGLNLSFSPGDLMLIEDHLNLIGANPLRGINDSRFGPRFPDMTFAYDPTYREIAVEEAAKIGLTLQRGIYAALSGPTFETPAEIAMLRAIGASAAGMSTVPEVIVARHMGMRVLGISCISNLAAGTNGQSVNHEEVLETGLRVSGGLAKLLQGVLPRMCAAE